MEVLTSCLKSASSSLVMLSLLAITGTTLTWSKCEHTQPHHIAAHLVVELLEGDQVGGGQGRPRGLNQVQAHVHARVGQVAKVALLLQLLL